MFVGGGVAAAAAAAAADGGGGGPHGQHRLCRQGGEGGPSPKEERRVLDHRQPAGG